MPLGTALLRLRNRKNCSTPRGVFCQTVSQQRPSYTNSYWPVNTNSHDTERFLTYAFRMDETMSDILRNAIRNCGLSANELAKRTGVPQPTITRFLAGKDLRLSRAQKIAAFLGLRLVKSKRSS